MTKCGSSCDLFPRVTVFTPRVCSINELSGFLVLSFLLLSLIQNFRKKRKKKIFSDTRFSTYFQTHSCPHKDRLVLPVMLFGHHLLNSASCELARWCSSYLRLSKTVRLNVEENKRRFSQRWTSHSFVADFQFMLLVKL